MLKLNAGFSRKVGEPNYGSRGASVNVELEVESGLIGDAEGLMARIRRLFELARRSVDDELAQDGRSGPAPVQDRPTSNNTPNRSTNPTSPQGRNGGNGVRQATASQIRAIRSICQRQRLDADDLARERVGVQRVEELTLQEASSILDELKGTGAQARPGGGR